MRDAAKKSLLVVLVLVCGAANSSQARGALMSLDRMQLYFAALRVRPDQVSHTPDQVVFLERSGSGAARWTAQSDRSWLALNLSAGTGPARLVIGVRDGALSGSARTEEGNVAIIVNGDASDQLTVHVTLAVLEGGGQPPFGSLDGPPDGTVIRHATPIVGWALDDAYVADVAICRGRPARAASDSTSDAACAGDGKTLLGHAVFSEGGRPDVERAAPTAPMNTRNSWAFVLDPATLRARGTFRLYAIAHDVEGHSTVLGTKLVTVEPELDAPFWSTAGVEALLSGLGVFGIAHVLVWALLVRKSGTTPFPHAAGTSHEGAVRWTELAAVLLIVAGFVALNLRSMTRGLGYDELYTASHFVVGLPPWRAATLVGVFNNHMAYSLLAGLAVRMFGTAEWVVRLPALALGSATVYMVWRFARTFASSAVALLSASLLALSPFFGDWAHAARGYSGLALMALISSHLFLRLVRTRSGWDGVAHAVATTLASYFHLYGLLILAVQYGFFLWVAIARRPRQQLSAHQVDQARGLPVLWASFLAIGVGTTLLYLPVATRLMEVVRDRGSGPFRPGFGGDLLYAYAGTTFALGVAGVLLLVVAGMAWLRTRVLGLGYLIALLLAPLLVMWLLVHPPDLYPRFFAYWTPVLAFFMATGVGGAWARARSLRKYAAGAPVSVAWTLAVVLTVVSAAVAVDWVRKDLLTPHGDGYREVLVRRPGEPAWPLFFIGPDSEMFDYYLGKPLAILHFPQDLDRAMRAGPIRVAYHNMTWNSPEEQKARVLLDRRCAPDDRGPVTIFTCGG